MSADDLLAALDPEQRAVAEALRGPVRVLAGAGTGKTRAITHRIAYGVATGVYNPTEVLAVTFTTRAAGEMRARLRTLGAAGVQARTFHSAALRQVRYFWPRVYGGEPPAADRLQARTGRRRAARRNRVQTDQARLRDVASRDRVVQGQQRPPRRLRAGRAHARPRGQRARPPHGRARCSPATRSSSASRAGWTWRTCCSAVPRSWPRTSASRPRCAGSTSGSWSTSSRTSRPIQAALLDLWLGGRDEICVVGDPAQTIYSLRRRPGVVPHRLPDASTPHTTSVELVRNYRSTPQVIEVANKLLAGTASAGVQLRAQREPGAAVTWREAPDEVAEADAVAARDRAAAPRRHAPARDGDPVPDQRPVRGVRGGADLRRHPLRRPRRGPLLRPPPRCARRPR